MRRAFFNASRWAGVTVLVSCSLQVLACSGDDDIAPQPDASDAVDASVEVDASLDAAVDGGTDATSEDAGAECAIGRRVAVEITAEGASLDWCGAQLTVPAGVLELGAEVGIEIVAPPAEAWSEHALSGPVFRFWPDTARLPGAVTLGLTRDTSQTRGPVLARWLPDAGVWAEHEACLRDDVLSLDTVDLGIFALMQDTVQFPPSRTGLGQADVELELQGEATTWTVPGGGGYTVYEGSDTERSIILVAHREVDDVLQVLDLRMIVSASQPASLLQVSLFSTDDLSGSWGWLEPVDGAPVSFTLDETSPGTYAGALEVMARKGDATELLEASFTFTPEKFRPPPSYSCGFPEGDQP